MERRDPNWRWVEARPQWFHRFDPRARLVAPEDRVQHGFDAHGRLRIARQDGVVRLACVPRDDGSDYLMLTSRRAGSVQLEPLRRVMEKPDAVRVWRVEAGALYERTYAMANGGCARSSITRKVLESHQGAPARYYGGRVEERYAVEHGQLQQALRREYDRTERCVRHDVVFSRARADLATTPRELEEAIVESVVSCAQRVAAGEKLRAILIAFGGEDDIEATYFDVSVQFVRSELAEQLRGAHWGPDSLSRLGVTAYRLHDPACFDERLVELFAEHAAHYGLYADRVPTRRTTTSLLAPIRRAAWTLNDYDWASVVRPTDDFVVLARDTTEAVDLAKDVRLSVPKSHWRRVEP